MKVKILLIEPQYGKVSGAQKVTLNVFSIFKSLGYSVRALLPRAEKSEIEQQYLALDSNIRYYNLPGALGTGGFDGLSFLRKMMIVFTSLCGLLSFYIRTTLLLLSGRFTHIYTYDPRGLFLALPLSMLTGKKLIWHLHGYFNYGDKIFRFVQCFCDVIITPSDAIKNSLPQTNKTITIYNGFDYASFSVRHTSICVEKPLNLLFVGILTPQKGLHRVLEGLADYRLQREIVVNIVGDVLDERWNWFSDYLDSLIAKLPQRVRVKKCGWMSNVSAIMSDNDYLIFPSQLVGVISYQGREIHYKGSEALPTVIIEALASGLPVIANNVPGVSEILTDKEGILCDVSEPEQFLSAIDKICQFNTEEEYHVDYMRTRKHFSLEKMRDAIATIFN